MDRDAIFRTDIPHFHALMHKITRSPFAVYPVQTKSITKGDEVEDIADEMITSHVLVISYDFPQTNKPSKKIWQLQPGSRQLQTSASVNGGK